jgi:3-oxoacyl-[acyl-carrier protein] reductase
VKLENKVAIITGAGRGIGKAIATRLADEGAKVAICDIESAYAENLAERLRKTRHEAIAFKVNVNNLFDVGQMFTAVESKWGTVHILVNNAGVRHDIPVHKMTDQDWESAFSVQVKGCFNCARFAQQYMVAQKYGRIINISSPLPASLGEDKQTAYASANAAINGFTKALAIELGPFNITANAVAPDYIDTELLRNVAKEEGMYVDDFRRFASARIALRRMGTPEDVAGVVQFLASDDASFVTGQIIQVNGNP